MNQALLREKVIFDLWSKKSITSDLDTEQTLEDLVSKGLLDRRGKDYTLNEAGQQYVLHGRDTSELIEFLSDIDISQEERTFLANAIKEMADKPFVYEIIKTATANPNRENYPSVDLGAYEDIEHGVLFGANTHIMIDYVIGQETMDNVLKKLEKFGAVITEPQKKGYGAHVLYNIGNTNKELYLVGNNAMKIDRNMFRRRIESGIFALMMKGGGKNKDLLNIMEHYSSFLIEGGFLLTSATPKANFKKIVGGILGYWSNLDDQNYRACPHGLYQKTPKG